MKIAVVTSLNKKLYDYYGHKFYETYNWDFDLFTYTEDADWIAPKGKTVDLFKDVPECKEFVERNKDKPVESFLYDGVRFCYKVYGYTDLILNRTDYDGVIYIDADSVFYKPIDHEWVSSNIHKDECMMAYLGRIRKYSECGFLYFNMNHEQTKSWARRLQDMYSNDEIYQLREWHDSYVVDQVRIEFEKKHGVKNHNIGFTKKNFKGKGTGHVQAWSVLGSIYDHCKGKRKDNLRSPENRQLVT